MVSFNAKRHCNAKSHPGLSPLCANGHVCQVNSAALPSFSLPPSRPPALTHSPIFLFTSTQGPRGAAAVARDPLPPSLPPSLPTPLSPSPRYRRRQCAPLVCSAAFESVPAVESVRWSARVRALHILAGRIPMFASQLEGVSPRMIPHVKMKVTKYSRTWTALRDGVVRFTRLAADPCVSPV